MSLCAWACALAGRGHSEFAHVPSSCSPQAIKDSGHSGKVKLAMDVAASEFFNADDKTYNLGFKIDNPPPSLIKSTAEMMEFYKDIAAKYPIVSIEDPFDQDHWEAYEQIVELMGEKVQIVGDDLLVTNPKRIAHCKERKAANALLLKVNQIGTITEAMTASMDSVAEGDLRTREHRNLQAAFRKHIAQSFR